MPLLDAGFEIPMRSRNDTDIRGEASARSHRSALSRLKEPKQHRLGLRRQFPDLIHEQGAAIEPVHQPHRTADRTRKGAALMAEELAAQELPREVSTVERLERSIPPAAQTLDGAGSSLLVVDVPHGGTWHDPNHITAAGDQGIS